MSSGLCLSLRKRNTTPLWGEEETKYTFIDMETMARAPILSNNADIYDKDPENLEAYGSFVLMS
jgi:hypothetical protein